MLYKLNFLYSDRVPAPRYCMGRPGNNKQQARTPKKKGHPQKRTCYCKSRYATNFNKCETSETRARRCYRVSTRDPDTSLANPGVGYSLPIQLLDSPSHCKLTLHAPFRYNGQGWTGFQTQDTLNLNSSQETDWCPPEPHAGSSRE